MTCIQCNIYFLQKVKLKHGEWPHRICSLSTPPQAKLGPVLLAPLQGQGALPQGPERGRACLKPHSPGLSLLCSWGLPSPLPGRLGR